MTFTTLLLAAVCAHAQVVVDPAALESVKKAGAGVAQKLAAPKVAEPVFESLVRRLSEQGAPAESNMGPAMTLESNVPAEYDEERAELGAILVGGELPPREVGEPGSGFIDLTLRYSYSHLQVTRTFSHRLKDGGIRVDEWQYAIGMDRSIVAVVHGSIVAGPGKEDAVRQVRMDPKDPWVIKRWRRIEKKLAWIGPSKEA